MKNTKIKNSLNGLKKRISEPEDGSVETVQSEGKRKNMGDKKKSRA